MSRHQVPHHPESEKAVIGEMTLFPERIEDIERLLEPGDFYDRTCQEAFSLLVEAWKNGHVLDSTALLQGLADAKRPATQRWMVEAIDLVGAWQRHCEVVVTDRARRQLLHMAAELATLARDPSEDPGAVAERVCGDLGHVEGPLPKTWDTAMPWEWYLDQNADEFREWVIPGLMRRRWRCIVVAGEGGGKSTLMRQFAMLAGQGRHPLHYNHIPFVRVLYVDMENDPFGAGHLQANKMRRAFGEDYVEGQVLHVPEQRGINLLARTDRRRLEAAVAAHRPDLLIIGPMYRMHRRSAGVTDEDAAAQVQEILDDLRIRYDLALLCEHHAPKGSGGQRDILPFGTSLWLRWPELGIGLERADKAVRSRLAVKHWREPREEHQWPAFIDWGVQYPWLGVWPDDSWQQEKF